LQGRLAVKSLQDGGGGATGLATGAATGAATGDPVGVPPPQKQL